MQRPAYTLALLALTIGTASCGSGEATPSACVDDSECSVPQGSTCQVALCDLATSACGTAPAPDGAACEAAGGLAGACQGGACVPSGCVAVAATDASCDGADDDCDGQTDEDFAGVATTCGVGACAANGQTTCIDGVAVDGCEAGAPAASDATCDGVDDDCDGAVDDDHAGVATTCGAGACVATGQLTCAGGHVSDTCQPGLPGSTDTTCDGVDNDCDGATDEEYAPQVVACGAGACQAEGTTVCVDGQIEDSCSPAGPGGSDAVCNGIDDDCDGQTDEDFAPSATTCGVGACAAVGQTACVDGAALDGCQAGTPAAADATCDGVDDDCDGVSDDDVVAAASACGVGACAAAGTVTCQAGNPVDSCSPGAPLAVDDVTCDGVDDDCDGQFDEQYVGGPTTCGEGACAAAGDLVCIDGQQVDSCVAGIPGGGDASCNGFDDDCDGATDEDYAPSATACGEGACATVGELTCVGGGVVDTCTAGSAAFDDATCDGVDDDCDGATDEDYAPSATACGVGGCAAVGQRACVGGVESDSCAPGAAAAADTTCDGVDDDCDGSTDEEYAPPATTCGVGACAASGTIACVSGVPADSCVPGQPGASDATCDGVDDDCDGQADEEFAPTATDCGVGACQAVGTTVCQGGVPSDSCSPSGAAGSDAVCNGIDDDCDGATDEDFVPTPTACGVGACAATGATACAAGVPSDSCVPGAPAASDATCDGVDDDCNGATDEDYVISATACGVGSCARAGNKACVAGLEVDSCVAGTPAASDATCDDLDDDCNGQVDEDYVVTDTSCGVGACASVGQKTCSVGVESDSCVAGTPAASDTTCDNVDDDCNGVVDEDYVVNGTACGVGGCASTGQKTCSAGVESDSCTAGVPALADAGCNAVDDNCDGQTDEGYVVTATACGVGACASVGQKTCSVGVESDSCVAGTPAASDTTCDNVDDDCNGVVDEDYVVNGTACGVGACASTGQRTCAGGQELDSCVAGTPAASDPTCDGVDDDCNGVADEGYVVTGTGCGVGACASSGQKTCVGGQELDSCVAGIPGPSDATCDNVDDNCSGQVDEGYVVVGTACGVGACASTGQRTCAGGQELDSCVAGTPAASDPTCDGVDDDCDAVADEDYAPVATTCGAGICASTGSTSCSVGSVNDSCAPGSPVAEACNTKDDDCDGLTDEPSPGMCPGSGVCGAGACHECWDGNAVVFDGCDAGTLVERQVNTTADFSEYGPALAALTNGGFVVAWSGTVQVDPMTTSDVVVGQLFTAAGEPAGPETVLSSLVGADDFAYGPAVAAVSGGGYLATWSALDAAGVSTDLVARGFSDAGAPLSADFVIVPSGAPDPAPAAQRLASLPGTHVVQVWQQTDPVSALDNVLVQVYGESGLSSAPPVAVLPSTASRVEPTTAVFPDGRFVVAWSDDTTYGAPAIGVQFFAATGDPDGIDFPVPVDDPAVSLVSAPSVAAFPDGGFVVAFVQNAGFGASAVVVQQFGFDGLPAGPNLVVGTDASGGFVANPEVAAFADGGFVVAWTSATDGDGSSVAIRFYAPGGSALTGELQANTYTVGDQASPVVNVLQDGSALLAWDSCWWGGAGAPQDGGGCGVYAQRFSPTGARIFH